MPPNINAIPTTAKGVTLSSNSQWDAINVTTGFK